MSIYEKLFEIQQELKAPKGQFNEFSNFKYRSCEDILEAVKPILKKYKVVIICEDILTMIGERYYVKAIARLCDVETGEKIDSSAYARETDSRSKMDPAQITGAASSYARKYALNGLLCIDDAKDADSMDNRDCEKQKEPQQRQNMPKQIHNLVEASHIATIRAEIERTGAKEKAVCYSYGIRSLNDMTMEQYRNAMDTFKEMPTKQQTRQMSFDEMPPFR